MFMALHFPNFLIELKNDLIECLKYEPGNRKELCASALKTNKPIMFRAKEDLILVNKMHIPNFHYIYYKIVLQLLMISFVEG